MVTMNEWMDRGERERRERRDVGLALHEENSSKPSTACHATTPHSSAALALDPPPTSPCVSVSHDLAVRRVCHPREPRLLPGQAARHAVEKANEDVEPNKVVRRHQDLQISAALGNVWFYACGRWIKESQLVHHEAREASGWRGDRFRLPRRRKFSRRLGMINRMSRRIVCMA